MPRTMLVLDGRTRGMVCDLYFLGYPPWIGLRKPHLDVLEGVESDEWVEVSRGGPISR
jgi:hypothetical protein